MTVRKLFTITISVLITLAIITGVTYMFYKSATQQQKIALDYRHQALLLSEEMETDSADLTNSVRLYAMTGQKKWRDAYFYVLDKASGKVPHPDGTVMAFDEKVKAINLTPAEEKHLLQSKAESNGLVVVEVEVMDAVDAHAQKYGYGAAYLANKTPEIQAQALRLFDNTYNGFLKNIAAEIDAFNTLLFSRVEQQVDDANSRASIMQKVFFTCLLALVLVTIFMIIYISRFIEARLGSEPAELADIARRISEGDLSIDFTNTGQEKGVYLAMRQMRNQLSLVIEKDIQSIVDAAQRGDLSQRITLEGKDGCFGKLSESINNLVNVNDQVIKDMLRVLGAMARGDLGQTIDSDYQGAFDELKQDTNLTINKLTQVIEGDIQQLVNQAKSGNLSERISLEDKEGFFKRLSTGINELVEVNDKVIKDTVRVFGAMARGDLGQTIDSDYQGAFNELKKDANLTIKKLAQVIEGDIQQLVNQAKSGNLSERINLDDKDGFFKTLSTGINDLVEVNENVITDISRVMGALAQGDLSEKVTTNYQGVFARLKDDLNNTIIKLTDVISKIRSSASEVNTAANEIAQGNADLSQRTEEQASSLEQTASSMEEITSTVKQSANSSKDANILSSEAKVRAEEGGNVVKQAVDAMSEILRSSNKINDIIGVIDEIAFQTNLLALNAAVEAARAGEQGRGFAVVAGEVRNLSQRSATAAKEIKDLIKDSVAKVEAGSVLVNDSGTTLTSIVHAVDKVAGMISEISNASAEQTLGIEQINQAVSYMDEMTQQNAALVEEASAASEAMSEQAGTMSRLVSFFKLGDTHDMFASSSTFSAPAKKESIMSYKPETAKASASTISSAKAPSSSASFAKDDEWEDF